jgi:uncharacterized membrane protein YoaK (UPF0700 family)
VTSPDATTAPGTANHPTRPTVDRLPAALSFLAGVTDVTSWLLLGGLFTAHITGNLVVLAADVVTKTTPHLAAVLALPVFVVTTVGATAVARRLSTHPAHTRRVLLGAQASLLVAAAVLSFAGRASSDPDDALGVIIGMCAVAAMASQNAYLHLVPAKAPSTAVMTGNLVAATIAVADLLASWGKSASAWTRWTASWPLLAGFIGGCFVGAGATSLFGDHAAVVPAVLAVVLFIATAFRSVETAR